MRGALPLVTALVPLAILPGVLFYFDVTPKVMLLLLGCVAVLITRLDVGPLLSRTRGLAFLLLIAVQCLSLALSTAFSAHPGLSLLGSNWRRFGLLTQVAVALLGIAAAASVAGDSKKLIPLLKASVVAGIAAALYGCAQYFGIDPWLPAAAYHFGEGEWSIVRPPSTLGHASYAASFYLQAVFAGIALGRAEESQLWRFVGWAAAALGSVAIVLSGTRGAMVGWFAGALALAFLLRPVVSAKRLAGVAAIVAACAVFYVTPPGEKLRSRTRWSAEDSRGGARFQLWQDAARMGADRWAVGWGPESFVAEFPRYQSRELARQFPDFYHESPHNLFLDAWTAQGVLGLAAMIGLCLLALRAQVLQRQRGSVVQATLCAGFIALAVSLQFISFTAPTALGFYLTLGLLVALDPPDRAPVTLVIPRLVAILICLAAVAYVVQVGVTDRMLESVNGLIHAGRLADAERVYTAVRKWQPIGPSSDLWYSRALPDAAARSVNPVERFASLNVARQAAERAAAGAEDRQNAYYTLAQIHSLSENVPGVVGALRQAIAVAPMWFKPHWTLAETLELTGQHEAALAEARLAADLDAGKDQEVMDTLKRLEAR